MSQQNIFELAVRNRFRFNTPQGQLTPEDLFDLPLQSKTGKANLDQIAIELHRQLKQSDEAVSFVTEVPAGNTTLQAKFDLVKYVIEVKREENAKAADARAKAETKQRILSLISQKQDQKLAESSIEDLQKMLVDL